MRFAINEARRARQAEFFRALSVCAVQRGRETRSDNPPKQPASFHRRAPFRLCRCKKLLKHLQARFGKFL